MSVYIKHVVTELGMKSTLVHSVTERHSKRLGVLFSGKFTSRVQDYTQRPVVRVDVLGAFFILQIKRQGLTLNTGVLISL